MGWLFREQPLEDYGIDAHIEVVDDDTVRGKLVALQIKAGRSYFSTPADKGGWWFRAKADHFEYWLDFAIPVAIALVDLDSRLCHWQLVTESTVEKSDGTYWKLRVPKVHVLDSSAVQPLTDAADNASRRTRGPLGALVDKRDLIESVARELFAAPEIPLGSRKLVNGTGLYCLYYSGADELYCPIANGDPALPLYVGAAASNRRFGDGQVSPTSPSALSRRLQLLADIIREVEHRAPSECEHRLFLHDFTWRRLVVDDIWANAAEQFIVQQSSPIWNRVVRGFGSHSPGSHRKAGRKSRWDTLHPGRERADSLESAETVSELESLVQAHFKNMLKAPESRSWSSVSPAEPSNP